MVEVKTFDTMSYLKSGTKIDEEKVTSKAKKLIKGAAGLFITIFTGIFSAIISVGGGNIIVAFLSFSVIILSCVFLYFYIKSRTENTQLRKDTLSMAKKQVENVDYLTDHFKGEITKTMHNLEERYSNTIVGLTCQLNDLIKEMCDEREKLHTLIMVMTTDSTNGMEHMTTEV